MEETTRTQYIATGVYEHQFFQYVALLADDPCFAREFWYEYLVKANYVSQIAFTPPRSERDAVGWAAHGLLWLLSSNIWIKVRTKHNISNIGSRKP